MKYSAKVPGAVTFSTPRGVTSASRTVRTASVSVASACVA